MKQPINNRRSGRNKHNMEPLNINIDSRNYDDLILPPDAEGEEKTVYDAIIRTNGLRKSLVFLRILTTHQPF